MDKEPDIVRQHPAIYDPPGQDSVSRREALIAVGRIVPAKIRLWELGPPLDEPHDVLISEALSEQRSAN